MLTFVYKNLNKGTWSCIHKAKGERVFHQDEIVIQNVTFKVSEAGRQRVLRDKQRNVHAKALGEICETIPKGKLARVSYNPYKGGFFYIAESMMPIEKCDYLIFNSEGCFCLIQD